MSTRTQQNAPVIPSPRRSRRVDEPEAASVAVAAPEVVSQADVVECFAQGVQHGVLRERERILLALADLGREYPAMTLERTVASLVLDQAAAIVRDDA